MQYGIDLVVVDNIMTVLDVDMDKDEYRCKSEFVKKLSRPEERIKDSNGQIIIFI